MRGLLQYRSLRIDQLLLALMLAGAQACAQAPARGGDARTELRRGDIRPGITVLLTDSLHLVKGKRGALITNQTGVDANGVSDVDLLQRAGVELVRLFSPEHGIRGTEDVTNLPDVLDERSGLIVHSLYTSGTIPPPDSLLNGLDVLLFDLQDIGTRTWTYVGLMVYSMRAAERAGIPFIVLDRPNPLGGRTDGPMLDSALAYDRDPSPQRRGQAYALYHAPLRHGMTMGELALFFAGELKIGVQLHVVPVDGWRRSMWWDETRLPWIVPSPAMVSLASATIYPSLVAFEGTNVSVGRGTNLPFQRFGAPWMNADSVVELLKERPPAGVRFEVERFTPSSPTDGKYGGMSVPGVRVIIEDRDRIQSGRLGGAILWAIATANRDSLRITDRTFDLRFGSSSAREALLAGRDPDEVLDGSLPDVVRFQQNSRKYHIYR